MTISRRRILLSGSALAIAWPWSAPVRADTWPSKPVRVIIPFGAGSAADVIPRLVMEQVSVQIGQPVVVENRAGAGSTTGTALVAKSDPDGYTLLATSSAFTISPSLYSSLGYDPLNDLSAVALFGGLPNVLIVPANAPHATLAEFVANARAKPGALNFASLGVGSAVHMAAERFRLAAGYEATHVAFRSGSEALTEIVAGRIDYYFCPVNTALPFIRDGKVKALGVNTPKRIDALPNVPTTLEAGFKDSDSAGWVGVLVPAATPKPIQERLHKEITTALANPAVRDKLQPNGVTPMPLSPAEFQALVAEEIKANAEMVKRLQLKPN